MIQNKLSTNNHKPFLCTCNEKGKVSPICPEHPIETDYYISTGVVREVGKFEKVLNRVLTRTSSEDVLFDCVRELRADAAHQLGIPNNDENGLYWTIETKVDGEFIMHMHADNFHIS